MSYTDIKIITIKCVSFFVLILLPPLSTLFPYTTLFRSVGCGVGEETPSLALRASVDGKEPGGLRRPAQTEKDRKSTRLNSSHANISYAVFCLKKKKKYNTIK